MRTLQFIFLLSLQSLLSAAYGVSYVTYAENKCPTDQIKLNRIKNNDYVNVSSQSVLFEVAGKTIESCASENHLRFNDATNDDFARYSCKEMSNLTNGGVEHEIKSSNFSMWLWVDQKPDAGNVKGKIQIGFLEEGVEKYWLVTNYICPSSIPNKQVPSNENLERHSVIKNSNCPEKSTHISTIEIDSGVDIKTQSVGFNVDQRHIEVCANENHIELINVTDNALIQFTCAQIMNQENDGVGYFPEGSSKHLWFAVNQGKRDKGYVQIGLYHTATNTDERWIVSNHKCDI